MAYKLPNFTVTAQIQIIEKPNTEKKRLGLGVNFQHPERLRLDEKVAEFKTLVDAYEI